MSNKSNKMQPESARLVQALCRCCGKPFTPSRITQELCSEGCRQQENRLRSRRHQRQLREIRKRSLYIESHFFGPMLEAETPGEMEAAEALGMERLQEILSAMKGPDLRWQYEEAADRAQNLISVMIGTARSLDAQQEAANA